MFTFLPPAYLWHKYCQELERSSDSDSDVVEDVDDSDGGGPEIVEIFEPDVPHRVRNSELFKPRGSFILRW